MVLAKAHRSTQAVQAQAERPTSAPRPIINVILPKQPEEKGFLGVSSDGWVAIFTGVLTLATIGMGYFTYMAARAAKDAAEALPILERAYIYLRLTGDNVASAIAHVDALTVETVMLSVDFQFKNFGKTPARLVGGQVELYQIPFGDKQTMITDWPIGYMDVLGENEETSGQNRRIYLPRVDLPRISSGQWHLLLRGYIEYFDIWGKHQVCDVDWKYNPALKRFTPNDQRGGGFAADYKRHLELVKHFNEDLGKRSSALQSQFANPPDWQTPPPWDTSA